MSTESIDNIPVSKWATEYPILANIATAILYFALAQLGYLLAGINADVSPFWPSSGLALAAAVIGRWKVIPGIALGVFVAHYHSGLNLTASAYSTIGVTTEPIIGLLLLEAFKRYRPGLGEFLLPAWIVCASLICPIIGAVTGAYSISYLDTLIATDEFRNVGFIWWMGDAMGILIMAPAILSISRIPCKLSWFIKVACFSSLAAAVFTLIYTYREGAPLLFLAFPLVLLACHLFGPTGSAWTTLGFATFFSATLISNRYFGTAFNLENQLLHFNIFLTALAVTSLVISSYYQISNLRIASLVLLLGWFVSGWLYFTLSTAASDKDQNNFISIIEDKETAIKNQFDIYQNTLIASTGYFINSDYISTENWRNYINIVEIQRRYPGIMGVGFIMPFTSNELDHYVQKFHQKEKRQLLIKPVPHVTRPNPDTTGKNHFIITHIEPYESNREALGVDIATERNRITAAQRSRDTGTPIMTDRITLVQDGQKKPGFLLFVPIYRPDMPTNSINQRRAACIGWAYAPFKTEEFIKSLLGKKFSQVSYEIYDNASSNEASFVFSSANSDQNHTKEIVSHLNLGGQILSIAWGRSASFKRQETYSATIAAASLALGTCLLVGILISLQNTNRHANHIVATKTRELQELNNHLKHEVEDRTKAQNEATQAKHSADAANLAKSEFLATMSHEIRTPMNSVVGFAELLANGELNSEQRIWANYIQTSGNSLLSIINDILDFSKIEAGRLELENIPFSPSTAVQDVVGSLSPNAGEKGLFIDFNTDPNAPRHVGGDPLRFKQIITNLISNSLKFTPSGKVTVSIHWLGDQQKGIMRTTVTDTGVGIAPDKMDSLFKEFSQIETSVTRKFGGTGLGLSICKKLTNLMQGKIWAESTPGKGTTITFEIPFKTVNEIGHSKSKKTAENYQKDAQDDSKYTAKVLLVDDNKMNLKLGKTILQRLKCDVDIAINGLEAIEAVRRYNYPLIFMDCQMPEMDGYEATREIRRMEKANELAEPGSGIPITIIALTANISNGTEEQCIESGMDAYLSKPCNIVKFKKALDSYVLKTT